MYAEATIDEQADLPKRVIIFVDELNKYAPARRGESESSILEYVLDISARGRSLGVVLVSAEQFMSEVHGQVVGNSSTKSDREKRLRRVGRCLHTASSPRMSRLT